MRPCLVALSVTLIVITVWSAAAQETTGVISGRVVDTQRLAVAGVTVTANGSQGIRAITTDADGRYTLPLLTPGVYTVRAELPGFKTFEQREVIVRLGQTVNLELTMQVGVTETVDIPAPAPVVNTKTTTVGIVISADMLTQMPIGRRFTDALYMAPGVSSSGVGTGGTNPSMAGGSGLENAYFVDGVNITNVGFGAVGVYLIGGSLGTALPFDFMKEIQVKTSGYEAEFGMSTGGVVNVITRSGTNRFAGTGFGYVSPDALEAGWNQISLKNGATNTIGGTTNDIGVQAGGPIVHDRLFWIGAINPSWETRTFIAPEGFPLRSIGGVDRRRRTVSYSVKPTYQFKANHRIEASFFGDPAHGDMGPQRLVALRGTTDAGFSQVEYGGHEQVGRYSGLFGRGSLLEASIGRARTRHSETPKVNEWAVRDRRVVPNVISGGIGGYAVGNDGRNLQYSAKATTVVRGHQIRYGIVYEDVNYDAIAQRTGSPITLPDGIRTATGAQVEILPDATFGAIYRVVRASTDNVRHTKQWYSSVFVQDNWDVTPRLTIRPGLRYDQQKLVGNLASFTWDGNWAPRIGATYDISGSGRSKVFGNWGRFYARIPNDLAARALSAEAGVSRVDYFDSALTQPVPNGVLAAGQTIHFVTVGLSNAVIDPASKSTYLDEALIGVEREIGSGTSAGVRYVHRNMPRILEDVGTAQMVAYDLGLPGLASVKYFITNVNRNTPTTVFPELTPAHFEDPIHHYDAVEVTLDRRFRNNWALLSSYRWSRLFGNFEGFYRNDNGQSDPAITSLFDFPTDDPTYTSIGVPRFGYKGDIRYLGGLGQGPLPNDRTHQIKMFGNRTSTDVNIGVGVVLSSGRPLTKMAANPNYNNAGEIPEGPRGSGIQTVRDGFVKRTPFEMDVDVHADYALHRGTRRTVLLADAFNLFNLRRARDYQQNSEVTFNAPHPDYGQITEYQVPFRLRLGIRYEF
jgi:outer membrane receptor protein involved in Fe transport